MTRPAACPPAPGPLEEYAARFDDLFTRLAQRRGFPENLAGLLGPRGGKKTLPARAGAEPVAGAQHAAVQRLQFFLSESRWDADRLNSRRSPAAERGGPQAAGPAPSWPRALRAIRAWLSPWTALRRWWPA